MRSIECDVVVVGAGPAGSSTAKAAAERGARVIMLEEHPIVGSPVYCAEGLSIGGIRDAGMEPVAPYVAQKISRARVYAPNRRFVDLTSGNWVGYTLNRHHFDRALGDNAVRAGAELMTETRAKGVVRDGGRIIGVKAEHGDEEMEIWAKVTIGADGYWSITRRSAGLERWYPDVVSCAQYLLGGLDLEDPGTNEFYIGSNYAPGGYAWVFPKDKHTANVGLGVRKINNKPAAAYLHRFVESDPRFKGAEILRRNGGVTPVSGMLKKITDDGLMLVGDAAGELVPMTGAGIHSGIEAGKIAGAEAAAAVSEGDTSDRRLGRYRERFEEYWGKRIRDSRRVVEMLDRFNDDDLNLLAEVITNDEILALANGESVAKTVAKVLARSPGKVAKLMADYLF